MKKSGNCRKSAWQPSPLRLAISPMVAAYEVIKSVPPGITIVDEAIATARHVRRFISDQQHPRYYFMRGGGLGWGMPAAVGHSLGLGREPVVCLAGDGASLYLPQAFLDGGARKSARHLYRDE